MAAIRRQLPGLLRLVPRVAHVRSSEPLAPRSLVRGLSAAQVRPVTELGPDSSIACQSFRPSLLVA